MNHHLLGGLRTDALDHFGGVHRFAIERAGDFSIRAIDRHGNIGLISVVLLGGRYDRRFDPLEDNFLVDIFFAMNRIDDAKDFFGIHRSSLSSILALRGRRVRRRGAYFRSIHLQAKHLRKNNNISTRTSAKPAEMPQILMTV